MTSVASNPSGKGSVYTYDATGNTEVRDLYNTTQDLDWTAESKLDSITNDGKKTSYVYDAEGNRLLENSSSGTTLYLGETELTTDASGTLTKASRSYGQAGAPSVVRTTSNGATTGHKLNVLIADHLGTANTTVELSSGQPVTRRAFKPYGELRGTKPTSWPNKRSYLGVGIDDATTGLTHIGAREYDQNSGRFLSADPIIDITDPIQMNGYAYSSNSPVSNRDPSGLCADLDCPTRASPNHENRTPTESPSSGEPRYSQNYEAAVNSGNVYPASFIQKKTEIYPGVFVDRSWKYAEKYAQQLWKDAATWCQEAGPSCLTAPAADEEVAHNLLNHIKFLACMHLGRESGCASKIPAVGAIAMIAMTGMDGPSGFSGGKSPKKAPSGCNCFLANTDVLMADGETKDIEDVKLGDEVLATDPETGETGPRKVTRLIRTEGDKYFNELSIATEDGIEKLTATHEHPFWSPSEHDWIPAGKLKPGMTLRTDTGTIVIVTGNRPFTKQTRTYNLTIDDLHTYYVLAGATPVLVHNSSCTVIPNLNGKTLEEARAEIERAGFAFRSESQSGYIRFRHEDGSEVWIRPDGEVMRLAPKVRPASGEGKSFHPRLDPEGNVTQQHDPKTEMVLR